MIVQARHFKKIKIIFPVDRQNERSLLILKVNKNRLAIN